LQYMPLKYRGVVPANLITLIYSIMSKISKLSRAEMKNVLGGTAPPPPGDGGAGTCSVEVTCPGGSSKVSCSGSAGNCHKSEGTLFQAGWVQCDKDAKVTCSNSN
jgi:hypothetical protein